MKLDEIARESLSVCCGVAVRVENGEPDFIGDRNANVTCWFVCTACGKPCDSRRKEPS